jgi:hypothetical protein
VTRVAAWVRALTRRHRRALVSAPRSAMVLAPLPLPTRVFNRLSAEHLEHHAHRHEHRHLTVVRSQPVTALHTDVTTHVLRSHAVERSIAPLRAPGAAAPELVLAPARVPRAAHAPLPEAAAAVRALVEQLSGSHRRVESPAPRLHARAIRSAEEEPDVPHAVTRTLRAVPPAAAAAAPAMVLSRQAAALAQAAAQAAVAAATGPPARELVSPHHPPPPPVVDVESLTDRVVDQIDRRVNAQRERHGIF